MGDPGVLLYLADPGGSTTGCSTVSGGTTSVSLWAELDPPDTGITVCDATIKIDWEPKDCLICIDTGLTLFCDFSQVNPTKPHCERGGTREFAVVTADCNNPVCVASPIHIAEFELIVAEPVDPACCGDRVVKFDTGVISVTLSNGNKVTKPLTQDYCVTIPCP